VKPNWTVARRRYGGKALGDVEVGGTGKKIGGKHFRERERFLRDVIEAHPEIREETAEGWALRWAVGNILGMMTHREIGILMDISRQWAERIEKTAIAKVKLAGGRKLIDAYDGDGREPWE